MDISSIGIVYGAFKSRSAVISFITQLVYYAKLRLGLNTFRWINYVLKRLPSDYVVTWKLSNAVYYTVTPNLSSCLDLKKQEKEKEVY